MWKCQWSKVTYTESWYYLIRYPMKLNLMYTYQHFHLKSGYFNFRPCPVGYICLPHVGENPNFGFTSFDNLLWSMLTTFQLITLDYWENVYNMVRNRLIFFTLLVVILFPYHTRNTIYNILNFYVL